MKRAIFNFFVLQVVVWTVVFYNGSENTENINHASISDTWEVMSIDNKEDKSFVLHFPTFQKLTLKENGTFVRVRSDQVIEHGTWYLNSSETKLTLMQESGVEKYEIVQLPLQSSQSFIIKENVADATDPLDVEYELNRL
jgi:hypothetical protein